MCEGWTTRDLAAHLVVREGRLDAAPGIAIPFLAGYTDKVQRQTAASTDWDGLLAKIASGPPLFSPFKLIDAVANMDEMFIHHEDVRRAQTDWQPRTSRRRTPSRDCAGRSAVMARLTMGSVPARVTLQTPDGETVAVVGRGPELTVTGDVGELTLFIAGRDEAQLTVLRRADHRRRSAPRAEVCDCLYAGADSAGLTRWISASPSNPSRAPPTPINSPSPSRRRPPDTRLLPVGPLRRDER